MGKKLPGKRSSFAEGSLEVFIHPPSPLFGPAVCLQPDSRPPRAGNHPPRCASLNIFLSTAAAFPGSKINKRWGKKRANKASGGAFLPLPCCGAHVDITACASLAPQLSPCSRLPKDFLGNKGEILLFFVFFFHPAKNKLNKEENNNYYYNNRGRIL